MSGRYLTELADVLADAGCRVVTYAGWETRARSSGGYGGGRPWGVMWHHTASSADPDDDAAYMCHGSPDAPIANLLVARTGEVWVLAAGCTNTNGKGGPWRWSSGTVPADSMNTYAVGVELANTGTGETFPVGQLDAAFAASVAIVAHEGLDPGDVCTHQAYAPDRKIDPATADAVAGPWRPASCTSSGTWAVADLIAEHRRRAAGGPDLEVDAMNAAGTAYLGDELHVFTRGADAALWHQWHTGGRWHTESLGGTITGPPAAAALELGDGRWRVDVLAEGDDGALWQLWFDGARWSGWVKVSPWPGG